ncbi:polycomb group protein Psc-like [Ctenocephalides felis]|nr:polycomb group protein Psc-like [Ctenocephalides felis]
MYASAASVNRVGGAVSSGPQAGAVAAVTPSVASASRSIMMTTGDVSGEASGAAGDGAARQHPIAQRPIDRVLMVADSEPRPRLSDINRALTCGYCKGYLINAVKIEDCHHTFCRSCIVQYIKNVNKQCPTCLSSASTQSDKQQPYLELSNLILDRVLQSCVYKMVPGLYRREQQRQAEFYKQHGLSNTYLAKVEDNVRFICPDELMSLSVEYESTDARIENKPKMEKRYLQCPAAVTINHLEKLLRNKYSISPAMSIEIKYKKHSLSHQLSLMDVVYIYGWQRDTPMEFSYSIACAAAEPEDSASSDAAPPLVTTNSQDTAPKPKLAPLFKSPMSPQPSPPSPSVSSHIKHNRDNSSGKQHRDVSHSKHREGPARMIYDPENKHMQPRVELTEYAARIGLTAVKNGSSHYDFREEKADRLDEDRVEFAKKRDREWAAQKQLDERHHAKDDTNTHRKRKKAKHSKNEDNQYKRRKLHAQITSPESPEDALKMKVKLTPTPETKHKYKYHIEPITPPPAADKPNVTTNLVAENKDLSTKEKLLQMRAVRKDKVSSVLQSAKQEPVSQPAVSLSTSMPLLDKAPFQTAPEKTPMIKLPPLKLPTNKLTSIKSPPLKLPPIKFNTLKSPPIKTTISKSCIPTQSPPLKTLVVKTPTARSSPVKSPAPSSMDIKSPSEVPVNKRTFPTADNKSEQPPVSKPKLDIEAPNSVSKEVTTPKPTNSVTTISEQVREIVQTKPNSGSSSMEKDKIQQPIAEPVKPVEVKPVASTPATNSIVTKSTVVTTTPKVIRPPPATIPLVRIKKSVAKTVTFSTADKTFTTNAKMLTSSASLQKPPEANNPMCDNIGALDLSGKSSRSPTSDVRPTNSPSPPAANRMLNGVAKHKKPTENPMSNLQMLSESAVQILSQSKTTVSRMPIKQSIHNTAVRPAIPHGLRIPQLTTNPQLTHKQPIHTILKLNEIKGLRNTSPRPQNQSIRSIPNPSALNFRPAQTKPPVQDETKKILNIMDTVPSTTCSMLSDIKKNENLAKNLNLEKVTAELAGRASEANKLHSKSASQMTTP